MARMMHWLIFALAWFGGAVVIAAICAALSAGTIIAGLAGFAWGAFALVTFSPIARGV
jgi:hypothetical protein